MKLNRLKGAFVLTMGGLTAIAVTACRWQWRRHKEATLRWDTINSEIKNFSPNPISEILEPYRLTSIVGKILKDKVALVMRVKDGRMGYLVVVPVEFSAVTSTGKKGVLVNLGWIPEDMTSQLDFSKILRTEEEIGSLSITSEIFGLVKRDENLEVKRSKTLYPNIEGTHNLIDTARILEEFNLPTSSHLTSIFVDLLLPPRSNESLNQNFGSNPLLPSQKSSPSSSPHLKYSSLYPVTPSSTNFSGPYLTPRRHLEYCTFWAGTSLIGGTSIFYVLAKLK